MSRKSSKTGLGKRLLALREAKGKTQEHVARDLKLTTGTLSRWEREVGSPQAEQLIALAEYYDVSLDHLLLGEPTGPAVHSEELHRFFATPLGRYAQQRGLVRTLADLKWHEPITAEIYHAVASAFRDVEERRRDLAALVEPAKKAPKT